MARFYDTVSDADLSRVEDLLDKVGIEYSLRILGEGNLVKEIMVAEEDLSAAEEALYGRTEANN
ncbi:MAG: hypothetical protein A2X82_07190 [Geobacteraceae bacterium GWC2_55_20]|nr:MAG: hypothetical protein A2X82_07190 [Geobacteraceae bacterium GWC2_55_20]OGU25920.1 MAG: hypothetical protein A2X85_01730 [Geobacteraceae bacterium GWF2_54_21]HBA72376.1 hypothetical protein [Geobacter sp.]